jgi:hypothetical protein
MKNLKNKIALILGLSLAVNMGGPMVKPAEAGVFLLTAALVSDGDSNTAFAFAIVGVAFIAAGLGGNAPLVTVLPAPEDRTVTAFAQRFPFLCASDTQALADLTKLKFKNGEYEKQASSRAGQETVLVRIKNSEVDQALACAYSEDQINLAKKSLE